MDEYLSDEALIDRFLSGLLTNDERKEFEKKMNDSVFAEEVNFYRKLKSAAIQIGRENLKAQLKIISTEYSQKKPLPQSTFQILSQWGYPIAASIVFIISISTLYFHQSNYVRISKFSKRGRTTSFSAGTDRVAYLGNAEKLIGTPPVHHQQRKH